jgi:cathepsin B
VWLLQELMTHGPVESSFTVYEDFLTYKSGVYTHQSGAAVGGHAIKVMGTWLPAARLAVLAGTH